MYSSYHVRCWSAYGWEPQLQFEEGIEITARWYLENREWLESVTSGEYENYYRKMYSAL